MPYIFIFILSFLLVRLQKILSLKFNFVYQPTNDRWNKRIVALGGGIPVVITITLSLFAFANHKAQLALLPPLVIIFLMGIYDDLRGAGPLSKLLVEAIAAVWVINSGYYLPIGPFWIAAPITLVWLLVLTNGFNIIDNIDGLAGGTFIITGIGIYLCLLNTNPNDAHLALIIALSGLGFLLHNFSPAHIFLGDAGSLSIGFLLATLTTKAILPKETSPVAALQIPFLVLIPLSDIILVILSRSYSGRNIMTGGKDHCSHRLVSLGTTESKAVLLLYALGIMGVIIAYLLAPDIVNPLSIALLVAASALILLFIFLLLEVPTYEASNTKSKTQLNWQLAALPNWAMVTISYIVDGLLIFSAWQFMLFIYASNTQSYEPVEVFSLLITPMYLITALITKSLYLFEFKLSTYLIRFFVSLLLTVIALQLTKLQGNQTALLLATLHCMLAGSMCLIPRIMYRIVRRYINSYMNLKPIAHNHKFTTNYYLREAQL